LGETAQRRKKKRQRRVHYQKTSLRMIPPTKRGGKRGDAEKKKSFNEQKCGSNKKECAEEWGKS